MRADAERWFREATTVAADWPLARVAALKRTVSVAVVVPARDEAPTVGTIVGRLRRALVERHPLVDEVVVVDSASADATAAVAEAAGARVVRVDEPGKGRAMRAGVEATTADVVCFLDADLRSFRASWVTALVGPLLADPDLVLVKGAYERPGPGGRTGGGRITELLVRPLLATHRPELAGVLQPLGGEYAARRDLLEVVAFPSGYGIELGLLLDAHARHGLAGLAQVDLGRRRHRPRPVVALAPASAAILRVAQRRLAVPAGGHRSAVADGAAELVQWSRAGDTWQPRSVDVSEPELPPLRTVRALRSPGRSPG